MRAGSVANLPKWIDPHGTVPVEHY
ncbi:hypothetical protein RSAG8_04945, partial [Rhizoctonia solani AG-8 WAC10335]